MQQGQYLAFVFAKGGFEAIRERSAQRFRAAFAGFVCEDLLAFLQLVEIIVNLLFGFDAVPQGLADHHGDGQRVALGEAQQRPPVLHVAQLRPCLSARARASCTRSCIGMGGRLTRAGRSPSQARSSRREVSRNLALVARSVAQEIRQLALFLLAPGRVRARREAVDRLDVVPDPQHGDLVQHLQGHVPALFVAQGQPVNPRLFQRGAKDLPDGVQHACQRLVLLEGGERDTRPIEPPVCAYQRANSAAVIVLPLPA